MDYIKQFTDIEEYSQYRNSLEFVEPSLGMIGEYGIVKFYPTNDMDKNEGGGGVALSSGHEYGTGGGGGAFSSDHTYSQGGNGYQGIVIIYGR
jgi:hypothetical protein